MNNDTRSLLTTDPAEAVNASLAGHQFVLYQGSCAELLAAMPASMVDLFVTSPPYFMGKEYDRSYKLTDFKADMASLAGDCIRVVRDLGNMCWQVGYHVDKSAITPLDFAVHEVFSRFDELVLRNRIMWQFGHGAHARHRFSGRHETILWYGKGAGSYFDLDAVRTPQKYPGKRHYKGPNRGELSGNPLGKNPGDVWDIPNVKAKHCEKTAHPCQFPIGLVQRLTRSLAPGDGLVFDPFNGSGSTGIAASLDGRRYIGAELSPEYCDITMKRYEDLISGSLAYRPHDREIYVPSANTAVATRPEHFIA